MRVVGIGAGGHAKSLIELFRALGWKIVGLVDPRLPVGTRILDVPVLGGDDALPGRADGVVHAFLGMGMMGDARPRQAAVARAEAAGMTLIGGVHPSAIVAPSARIAAEAIVLAGAIVGADSRIEAHAIVNNGAVVDHDGHIGRHAHVATGARLSGDVVVATGALIGVGAAVRQGIRIGAGAIVGAGAAVVRDVEEHMTVVGVPARPLGRKKS